jgi:hypothetical protein
VMTHFSKDIAECQRRSEAYRREALDLVDPILRDYLFDVEEHWLALARSYEAAQRVFVIAEDVRSKSSASERPGSRDKPHASI